MEYSAQKLEGSSPPDLPGKRGSVPAWLQTAAVYALLLGAIWTRRGPANTFFVIASAAGVLAFLWFDDCSLHALGLRLPRMANFVKILTFGLALAVLLFVLALLTGEYQKPAYVISGRDACEYAVWALMQQFILQSFFFVRMESLMGSRRAVWATGLLFALAHIPSPLLTAASFAGGLIFCEMFRRYRSIYPLGLVHAVLGLTIAASYSDALLRHMRVGIGYLTYGA